MSVKIELPPENVKTIKNNKVTFVENFTNIDDKYDFNFLFSLLESISIPVDFKGIDEPFLKKFFK